MPFFDEAVGILGELGSNATFLSQHAIQPGVNEWSAEREFIANRLKTEIFNLTLGVEKRRRSGSPARPADSQGAGDTKPEVRRQKS